MRSSRSVVRMGGATGIDPRRKTKCVKFSLPTVKNGSGSIVIENEELEFVGTTVFLGFTLDNILQWGPHIGKSDPSTQRKRKTERFSNPFDIDKEINLHVDRLTDRQPNGEIDCRSDELTDTEEVHL
ncbi:hypothetical protein EVAR_55986_1 [Eumeta japonica]|uniref:Uncharacterized protein n=1 Tax=Eumeta variegata TaxID=151549 RepID=A0A4C1YB93_EUMVA|nr:hypothetical protein EVAR_55986_1 [Eumeta japonica]